MDDILQRLERQIKHLIEQNNKLKQFNQQLNQSKFLLVHEKEILLGKQKKAVTQIQMLLSKLKSLEKLT